MARHIHVHVHTGDSGEFESKHPRGAGGRFGEGKEGEAKPAAETFTVEGKPVKKVRADVMHGGAVMGRAENYMGTTQKLNKAGTIAHSRREVVLWKAIPAWDHHDPSTLRGFRSRAEAEHALRYAYTNHGPGRKERPA